MSFQAPHEDALHRCFLLYLFILFIVLQLSSPFSDQLLKGFDFYTLENETDHVLFY